MALLVPQMDSREASGFQNEEQFFYQFAPLGGGGSGTVLGITPGTNIAVDNTDPANPIVSVPANTFVKSIVAGTNIVVTAADPEHPTVARSGGGGGSGGTVLSVTGAGAGIHVDNTDPNNPVVSNTGVTSLVAGTGITVSGATGAVTVGATLTTTWPALVGVTATNAGFSIPGATSTRIANWTVVESGTGFNSATGAFTVPATGTYRARWQIRWTHAGGRPGDVWLTDGTHNFASGSQMDPSNQFVTEGEILYQWTVGAVLSLFASGPCVVFPVTTNPPPQDPSLSANLWISQIAA